MQGQLGRAAGSAARRRRRGLRLARLRAHRVGVDEELLRPLRVPLPPAAVSRQGRGADRHHRTERRRGDPPVHGLPGVHLGVSDQRRAVGGLPRVRAGRTLPRAGRAGDRRRGRRLLPRPDHAPRRAALPELAFFHLLKTKVTLHRELLPRDYGFWQERGWLDREFYDEDNLPWFKLHIARALVKRRAGGMLKRYGLQPASGT